MTWLQQHLPAILMYWAIAGAVLGTLGDQLPAGKLKAFVMALAHLSPMNIISAVKEVSGAFVPPTTLLVLAMACAAASQACGPSIEQQSMVSAYGADQLECVYIANDRGQADSCRDAVRGYWCGPKGPLREAGACAYVPAADGGHP